MRRLRAWDLAEVEGETPGLAPETRALHLLAGLSHVALADGIPVAVVGATSMRERLWCAWMLTTDRWPEVALTVTKHVRRQMIPFLTGRGVNRVEARAIAGHIKAHRWLKLLGAVDEGPLDDYGHHRETYHLFSWTRTRNVDNVHVLRPIDPTHPGTAAHSSAADGQFRGRREDESGGVGKEATGSPRKRTIEHDQDVRSW